MTSSPAKPPPSTVKAQEKKRKAVFKQLLDSPFSITWYISTPVSLPALTSGNPSINKQAMTSSTSYAGVPRKCLQSNISILSQLSSHRPQSTPTNPRKRKRPNSEVQHPLFIDPPPLVAFLTIGFNPTTQHLESEIRHEQTTTQMRVVFVARGDTNSSQLYAHFPMMASMLPNLRLVSLAKGAEVRLCEALGLQRVGVLGVMVCSLRGS
jgi:hypothetical protein